MVGHLSHWILVTMRDFVIKHKAIFRLAIIEYAKIYPDPTKENVLEPNSPILLDIRDKFSQYYGNPDRAEMFLAAFKILICEYEHDPHYRDIGQWFLEELVERVMSGEWKPRPSRHPSGFWNEPRTTEGDYGSYHGRKFARFIGKQGQYERLEKLVEQYQKELTKEV